MSDYDYYSYETPETPPEQNEQPGRRAIGVFAAIVAIAVLFSALAGSVWLIANARLTLPAAQSRVPQTSVAAVDVVSEKIERLSADVTSQNKHFSLEEAARLASTGDKTALSVKEIARTVKPAVVAITTDISVRNYVGDEMRGQAAGSGFIISEDGYIVTNAHVVKNATGIQINLEDGRSYKATIVGEDTQTDLAVLKIEETGLPTVILGDSDTLEVGELAVAIGNPTGRLSGTVTAGIISALDRQVSDFSLPLIQTDATINKGNSGGVLINSFGEVVGINTLKIATAGGGPMANPFDISTFEGLNFAIPIDEAKPIIEVLIREGKVTRAMIGVSIVTITEDMADMQKDLIPGVLVREVTPRSAAAESGIRPGDTIVKFNGRKVATIDELRRERDQAALGSKVEVEVIRDNETVTLTLELRAE
ncbi:MAG TPA: PDZ domain-containing protein [Fastidiosipila sp.]|nr:PDZ domain-containing protein [Fastidiosipila sp.]